MCIVLNTSCGFVKVVQKDETYFTRERAKYCGLDREGEEQQRDCKEWVWHNLQLIE